MYSNDPCLWSSSCRPRTAGSMSLIALTTVTSELSVLRPPSRIGPWQISDRHNSASSATCTLFVLLGGPPCQLLPPQDVLWSLHQQRPQIGIAFLADVHLWLALSRVSASRLQSQIAAHIAALAEAMRSIQELVRLCVETGRIGASVWAGAGQAGRYSLLGGVFFSVTLRFAWHSVAGS